MGFKGVKIKRACFRDVQYTMTVSEKHQKTYLYNFDPLKPHFSIVKLGFKGVYIIFPTSAQAEIWKISELLSENLVFGDEIFHIFE